MSRRTPTATPRRTAVLGAGLGGLAAAIRLAAGGREVHLFEQHFRPGGKAASIRLDGFRFDTGPSLFTMREVFEELYDAAGERLTDHLELVALNPISTYFYPDGTRLRAWADPPRLGEEIERNTSDSAESIRKHLAHCKRIYESAGGLFLRNDLHSLSTYLKPEIAKALIRPWRIDPFRTMHAANAKRFRDPRTRQLFDRYATYNGSNPYHAPATLNIISYVEHSLGCYGVRGGIYRIVESLEAIALKRGVRIHYGSKVEGIHLQGGGVSELTVSGERLPFDVVVSNIDIGAMYRLLRIAGRPEPRAVTPRPEECSSSAVVFLWGMGERSPMLGLHNVFFSRSYRREFTEIFDRRKLPEDPTIYLHVSCKLTPSDAPAGGENWFLMVNAPPNTGQEWPRLVADLRGRIVRRLEETLGGPLERSILRELVLTPANLESSTGSLYGSLYGVASNSALSAFRRHPNRVPGVRGLYACGGSTHPGGGMPLVLLSAKIATELVERDER